MKGGEKSLLDFAMQCREMPAATRKATQAGVAKSALVTTTAIRKQISDATNGSNRLSGVGKRGRKVGANFKLRPSGDPSALIVANGPLHLIERDTSPHDEPRQRKRGKQKILNTPYGPRAHVNHPGTKGKHPFQKGVDEAAPKVGKVFQDEVRDAMRRIYG